MNNIGEMMDTYYIYMLRCEGNSLYTGIAKDYIKRYEKHRSGRGAKYTRTRKPLKIEGVWEAAGRSSAGRVEYYIKKQTRGRKNLYLMDKGSLCREVLDKLGIEVKEVVIKEVKEERRDGTEAEGKVGGTE